MRRQLLKVASIALSVALAASVGAATTAPVEAATINAPKIVGKACQSERGVTVVVDFRTLRNPKGKKLNLIKIGCARGDQESGFTALLGAGFDVDPDNPFVCTIDDRPIDPPRCPPLDGFWSYSHGERGADWELAGTGAGGWDPPPGSLEGWSWSPYDQAWDFPRLTPRDLFPPGPE